MSRDLHTRRVDGGVTVQKDIIVDEVRRVREEYGKQFRNDLRAMAEDLRRLEKQHVDRLVSCHAKPVSQRRKLA